MAVKWNISKQILFETVKRDFITKGYNTGFREIAKELGINPSLISYYFKSKENIAIEIMKENYQLLVGYLKNEIDADNDPMLFLVTFYTLSNRILDNNPDFSRFVADISSDNLYVYMIQGTGMHSVYEATVRLKTKESNTYDPEWEIDHFVACSFAYYSATLSLFERGFKLSPERFMQETVDYMYYLLGYEKDPLRTKNIMKKAEAIANKVLTDNPKLLNVHEYLIKEINQMSIEELITGNTNHNQSL